MTKESTKTSSVTKNPDPPKARRKSSSSKARLPSLPEPKRVLEATTGRCTKANEKRSLPKFSLYGKMCNISNEDGKVNNGGNGNDNPTKSNTVLCYGCKGSKHNKLGKDHPILLCDGLG